MRKPKEPVKPVNAFCCCDTDFDGPQAIKEHLKTAHGITEFKGRRSMQAHIDCADSFTFTFEWEINGVKFNQVTISPRHKPWMSMKQST